MGHASVPVLVAGAINTDLVATMTRAPGAGETITGIDFSIHGGGKGANQAVAAARSGATVHLVGSIGADDFGRARLRDLDGDGVQTGWVLVRDRTPSGVALIFVEQSGENRIAYVPGATLTVPPDHAAAALDAIAPGFVLSTNELPHSATAALFMAARRGGVPVVFNATPDPESALDLLANVSILIVNEGEAAGLVGVSGDTDPETLVARLLELGIETAVLTCGAEGVVVGNRTGLRREVPPTVKVVDTTGAGDTFCGALVAELSRGAKVVEAAPYAVVASALSVTRHGAQSSIPRRSEVLAQMKESR